MDKNNEIYNEEEISISELFKIIIPSIKNIILVTLVFAFFGALISLVSIKSKYYSESRVMVNYQDSNRSAEANIKTAETLAKVYKDAFKNDQLLAAVAKENENITVDNLKKNLSVILEDGTQFINLKVTGSDDDITIQTSETVLELAPNILENLVGSGSVEVVSAPSIKSEDSNIKMNLLVSTMLGLMFSLGYVFVSYLLNDNILSSSDMERMLDLPVIGIVPAETIEQGGN